MGFGNIVEMCRSESIETLNKSLCQALWSVGPSGDAGGPCQEVTAPGAEKLPTDAHPVTEPVLRDGARSSGKHTSKGGLRASGEGGCFNLEE